MQGKKIGGENDDGQDGGLNRLLKFNNSSEEERWAFWLRWKAYF